MKLFIKRGTSEIDGFTIYTEKGEPCFAADVRAEPSIRITLRGRGGELLSTIRFNTFMLSYFSVRCGKRLYVLVPCLGRRFAFAIYGSTFRFVGNLSDGRFSMLGADGETVMTQKKCWTAHGDGYELDIKDERYEIFMISAALCADICLALGESDALPTS